MNGRGLNPFATCYRAPITNSTATNYSFPINGTACNITLTGNKFSNFPQGVLGGVGERSDSLPPAVVKGNSFYKVAVAAGGLVPVILENNTFSYGVAGAVIEKSLGSRVVGNTASNNSGTGIRVLSPDPELVDDVARVGTNKATNNGGYGIDAPGSVDLGVNVVYGNKPGQCVGVVCAGK